MKIFNLILLISLISISCTKRTTVINTVAADGGAQTNAEAVTDETKKEADGHSVGNGGGFLIEEFLYYGNKTVEILRIQNSDRLEDDDIGQITADELFEVIQRTSIVVTSDKILDNKGSEVDARFDKDKNQIVIYEKAWLQHLSLPDKMFRLVFHEYLRALGVDDDQFVVSSQLNLKSLESQPEFFNKFSKLFTEATVADHKKIQGFYSGWCSEKENDYKVRQSVFALYHYNNGLTRQDVETDKIDYFMGEVPPEQYMSRRTFELWDKPKLRDYVLNYRYTLMWATYLGNYLTVDVPNGGRRDMFQVRESQNMLIAAYVDMADPAGSRNHIHFKYDEEDNLIVEEKYIYTVCYYNKLK